MVVDGVEEVSGVGEGGSVGDVIDNHEGVCPLQVSPHYLLKFLQHQKSCHESLGSKYREVKLILSFKV